MVPRRLLEWLSTAVLVAVTFSTGIGTLSSSSSLVEAFVVVRPPTASLSGTTKLLASSTKEPKQEQKPLSIEETTEKYGLEAGLFQSLREKNTNGGGMESAKSLLKKYGFAYLATSIPLAIVSFVICYVLVDNGVDMAGLLSKIGIESTDLSEKAGTAAIAYAAHKAASPVRFPPTVLLTPIVAKWLGKEPKEEE